MSGLIPIRTASAATLLSLAILAAAEFAPAQTKPTAYPQDASQLSVPLISQREMTSGDRTAAQSWQPAVASSAQFYGYTVDSSYTYRQIACPVAPNDLLLAYETSAPNGSVSRFTAVVPRGAEEEAAGSHQVAQIIPILHFGLVPFVPAIANPHSIEVFNTGISRAPSATEVLSADQAGNQPLLVRALCYLAMVGEEPAALGPLSSDQATIHAPIPTLVFQNRGKIRQQVSIRSRQNSYQVWALTFQSGGKLLTATRQEHPIDRTPLVLNAANSASPSVPVGTTAISPGTAQVSSSQLAPPSLPPPTTTAAAPVAPTETVAPSVAAPTPVAAATTAMSAPPVTPAHPPAVVASAPAVPSVIATPADTAKVERNQPAPLPPPAETPAPITEPVSTPVSASATSTVEPVSPATPAMAAPPPPPAPALVPAPTSPEPVAAVSTPQPPSPPAAPTATPIDTPTAISTPPAPAVAFVATPPAVKPSPPLPPGRFIPSPPQPPSRFIPDSALKTPPHLPQ